MRVSLPRFGVLSAILLLGVWWFAERGWLEPAQRASAWIAWAVSSAMGLKTTLIGCEIFTASRILDIAFACIPFTVLAIYFAGVLAAETTWTRRLLGCAYGLLGLLAANTIRVVAGVWAAQLNPALFDSVHQAGLMRVLPDATAFVVWLLWMRSGEAPS